MQVLPALQDRHERYKEQRLRMVGIDSHDTKKEVDIANFLAKRGVTYTVLFGGKNVAKDNRV
jgi:G:T-mismatch repair DNA endonuclease (very short patch repair protein)